MLNLSNNPIPVVTLSYNPIMLKHFLLAYVSRQNDLKDLVVVINDHAEPEENYKAQVEIETWNNIGHLVKLSEVEEKTVPVYNLKNFYDYQKCAPVQTKLLLPLYVKNVLGYDNMLWLDDDIIVNCDLQVLINELFPKYLTEWQPVKKEGDQAKIPMIFRDFWKFLSLIYKDALKPENFHQFISCCFWMHIHDDYPSFIQTYFQHDEVYNYLKAYTFNFQYRSGMGDALNALEEFIFNYYNMMHSLESPNYWIPPRFHSWTDRDSYRNLRLVSRWPLIHAHFQPKTQWGALYFPKTTEQQQK